MRKAVSGIMLTLLLLSMLTLVFNIQPVKAEDSLAEAPWPPELAEELSTPGRMEGTGTYFEIKDSEYLNISLRSTETIHVILESVPRMVSFIIESNSSATSTVLTFSGFEPNTTYYRYQNGYLMANFTTNAEGEYTYTQDISESHHVFIQEETLTLYIGSDYTFTSDIYETIIVTADNIVIDGNGYTLQGSPFVYDWGVYLYGRSNVTIKNVTVKGWSLGIWLIYSSDNTIFGNNMINNGVGVDLWYSSDNIISSNNITFYVYAKACPGVFLLGSSNNIISENTITNLGWGVYGGGQGNTISGNALTNLGRGVKLGGQGNTISGNTITNNGYGVYLRGDDNTISENNITNNTFCIFLGYFSNYNTISGNNITNNYYGVYLWWYSSDNIISNNNITNNSVGVIIGYSDNNIIFHNDLIKNINQAKVTAGYVNTWDDGYPSGGNYWSDYKDRYPEVEDSYSGPHQNETGSDGIWDHPYVIDADNQDRYPLVNPWTPTPPPENQPPSPPTDLAQCKTDGTPLGVGSTTFEKTVVFKGKVSDPDDDKVRLQVELRRLDEYGGGFNESAGGFKESELVESGSEATAYAFGLIEGDYHWRARTVDEHGLVSDWVDFGNNDISETDFAVGVGKILPVPYYSQGDTDWCVPTSMSMILKYYGKYVHSWDIAESWGWDRKVKIALETLPAIVSDYFKAFGLNTTTYIVTETDPLIILSLLRFDIVKSWIDKDMPILLSLSTIQHAVVIVGYEISETSQKVYINDPSGALINDEMKLSKSYPFMAVPVPWNELVLNYIYFGSYLIAVEGERSPPNGTIDEVLDYGVCFPFEDRPKTRRVWNYWYSDKGIIWEYLHHQWLDSRDRFRFNGRIVNHMDHDQKYRLKVQFAKDKFRTLNVTVKGRSSDALVMDPIMGSIPLADLLIPLADLLKEEYGEYTIRLWLLSSDGTQVYDWVQFPKIEYRSSLEIKLDSPADLYVTDPQGRHVGVDPSTGQVVNEIPGTYYTGPCSEPQVIAIPDPLDGNYTVLLIGKATGTYSLNTELIALQETTFVAVDIPISANATHQYTVDWDALSLGEEGVAVQVDSDGDGMFEHTFTSDSELSHSEYVIATDKTPPETWLNIGEPKFVVDDITYLTSATPITLLAEDNPGGSGVASTAYRIYNATYDSGWITYTQPFYLFGLSDGAYQIDHNSTDFAGNIELTNTVTVILDNTPPTTTLTIGEPKYVTEMTYVTLETPFTLEANDNMGSGVYSIVYRIYNSTYDSGWLPYTAPFYLTALADGVYTIEFNSTDNVDNVEPTNTAIVILDNTGPSITVLNPPVGWALQDGVTFIISAIDAGSGVSSLNLSVREANGGEGIPVGFEDLPFTYNGTTGKWTLFFDTLQLPDGYYVVLVKAQDNLGNIGFIIVPYSIRNWAVIELLPASETNKAGRTMPVKFSLRVAASVDPNQPFVYNEDLTIQIYATNDPSNILQTSTFGDTARDYRIDSTNELYITNFKTLKTPMQYIVSVYRGIFLIDSFDFSTVK